MVYCGPVFESCNSSGTVVFCSRMPSSCCLTRKHFAETLLNSSFTLSGIMKMTTVWREHMEGISSEVHSCVSGFVMSCCLSFPASQTLFSILSVQSVAVVIPLIPLSNSDSLARRKAQNSIATVRILCILFIAFINMLMQDSCSFFFFPSSAISYLFCMFQCLFIAF